MKAARPGGTFSGWLIRDRAYTAIRAGDAAPRT